MYCEAEVEDSGGGGLASSRSTRVGVDADTKRSSRLRAMREDEDLCDGGLR